MPASTWKEVAAQLAQLGLPMLGKVLGGHIPIIGPIFGSSAGEGIGNIVAGAIAKALGVEATPEAVSEAIETQGTTEVVATLKAVEAEAAVRWPALANIEESERKAEVAFASINAETASKVAVEVATNGFWLSLYRSLLMYFATAQLGLFGVLFFYGLIMEAPIWDRIIDGRDVIAWWLGVNGSVLGFHFFSRAQERKAAVQAPAQAQAAVAAAIDRSEK